MRYSASALGFFAEDIAYKVLPDDLVVVSEEDYNLLMVGQAEGKLINSEQLSSTIEAIIRESSKIDIQFQTHDAIDKLTRLNLLKLDGGNLSVPSIEQTMNELHSRWQALSP